MYFRRLYCLLQIILSRIGRVFVLLFNTGVRLRLHLLLLHHLLQSCQLITCILLLLLLFLTVLASVQTCVLFKRTLKRVYLRVVLLSFLRLIFDPVVMINPVVQLLVIIYLILVVDLSHALSEFDHVAGQDQLFYETVDGVILLRRQVHICLG